MLVRLNATALQGVDAVPVTVEVRVDRGIHFLMVGLPDSAVRESQQRIKSAIEHLGYRWPGKGITINLAPAGLRKEGDAAWNPFDKSFRNFDKADRDMQLGHLSPNFDRSGFAADLNVVYPIDRLEEMAEEGVIGKVADTHLSFMGAQDDTMSSIRMDTGPAAAKLLKDQGTDIVLLTPI